MLIVRTHQDAGVRVRHDGLLEGPRATQLQSLLDEAGARIRPVAGEPPDRLHRRRAGELAKADLACYFAVEAAGELDPSFTDRVREAADVEFAYPRPSISLPMLPPRALGLEPATGPEPDTPPENLRPLQGYLAPPPDGIGATAVWRLKGGLGAGVRIVDVEGDWRFTHEDLQHNPGGLVAGRPTGDLEARNHGTNVIGILNGVHNGRGIHGICPQAAIKCVSYEPLDTWGGAPAIKAAADILRPGDILLVEMQGRGPQAPAEPPAGELAQLGYLPMEYWPAEMTAIQYAVSAGIVVVAAAGNGAQHLDDDAYAGPGTGFRERRPNPFHRDGLDSGAVLVGAGAPPAGSAPARSRLKFSNWGSALDAQGWGAHVATTGGLGYGPDKLRPGPVEDRWYTGNFNGTSSAAPIVAGALACVQGVLRAAGRRPLTPRQVRTALRETGSPQPGPADERIGSLPDVPRLIEWAMDAAPPETTTTRRRGMKVTITIEDGDGANTIWESSQNDVKPTYIKGPYIKGPSLFLPQESGDPIELNIAALAAAAADKQA
jgi:hypothetical protein